MSDLCCHVYVSITKAHAPIILRGFFKVVFFFTIILTFLQIQRFHYRTLIYETFTGLPVVLAIKENFDDPM